MYNIVPQDTKDIFHNAFMSNNISKMAETYIDSPRNNFYIDVALEEGNKDVVDFFRTKDVKPSLFAIQMARINGHEKLAAEIESYVEVRNKINYKSVYWIYDRINKKFIWNDIIPSAFRF